MKNLLILITILLFSSCSEYIHDYDIDKACEICLEHRGIRSIRAGKGLLTKVRCQDGYIERYDSSEEFN